MTTYREYWEEKLRGMVSVLFVFSIILALGGLPILGFGLVIVGFTRNFFEVFIGLTMLIAWSYVIFFVFANGQERYSAVLNRLEQWETKTSNTEAQ